MNNELTLTAHSWSLGSVFNRLSAFAARPLAVLGQYYSDVLGRQLGMKQTVCLLHAQLAFFFTVFAASSLWLRVVCILWLVSALMRCRREL